MKPTQQYKSNFTRKFCWILSLVTIRSDRAYVQQVFKGNSRAFNKILSLQQYQIDLRKSFYYYFGQEKKQPTSLSKESNVFSWLPVLIESTVDNYAGWMRQKHSSGQNLNSPFLSLYASKSKRPRAYSFGMIWIWTYMILACTQAFHLGKLQVQGAGLRSKLNSLSQLASLAVNGD